MKHVLHGISVDVEDWYQSTIDPNAPLSDRFRSSTGKVLDSLAAGGVRATFFVLGLAAEKDPEVVRRIVSSGHEVQSHGYGHAETFKLSREEFRQDLLRAKGLLEDLAGCPIFGYRAPSFSIDERTPWALDALAETGHRYDSSIFPIKTSRYGVDDYPPEPQIVTTPEGRRIVEAPLACFHWFGKRLPVAGGGYFRLLPYAVIRGAFRQLDRLYRPGVIYFHPYEYDGAEMESFKGQVSLLVRLHQGLGRKGFAGKIDRLMRDFRFGPLKDVLADLLVQLDES
jgi:polysaccharide deacetylase family protein (PEP-CTERM system associated)